MARWGGGTPQTLHSQLPLEPSQVTLGSRVLAIGGYNGANVPVVEEFHVDNSSWTTKSYNLIQGRHHTRAVAVPASWFENMPGGCKGVI